MKLFESILRGVLLCGLVGLPLGGCGSDSPSAAPPATHDVFFNGYVYDGAVGTRLQGYTLEIQYRDKVLQGVVAADGRYLLGPIPVFQDYTVTITSAGYRTFRTHNAGYNVPGPNELEAALATTSTSQTHFFDAYLFPSALQAADITLNVRQTTTTGTLVPAGQMRLRAASASLLADNPATETPSGVPGQLWTNDEDLQAKPLNKTIADGKVVITGAEMTYGVTYAVTVYEVPGYQPLETTITAGRDHLRTLALQEETGDPLQLVTNTVVNCHPPLSSAETLSAVATFEFNQDIELSPALSAGGNAEIIDANLFISAPNSNLNGLFTTLRTNASPTVQERATSVTASGKILTLSWNPSLGLLTYDDLITQVTYSNLTALFVQPVGKPASKASLGTLYGFQVTCF